MQITAISADAQSANGVAVDVLQSPMPASDVSLAGAAGRLRAEPAQATSVTGSGSSQRVLDSLSAKLDQIRADFDRAQKRITSPSAHPLENVMNRSLEAQTDVFRLSVVLHAGLSLGHQSQNGVKTLIEKT